MRQHKLSGLGLLRKHECRLRTRGSTPGFACGECLWRVDQQACDLARSERQEVLQIMDRMR